MKPRIFALAGAALLLVTGLAGTAPASADPSGVGAEHSHGAEHSLQVCTTAGPGEATCTARQAADNSGRPISDAVSPPSTGLRPLDLQSAYKLTGLSAAGRTVAIIDAYGYPNLERDLTAYRSYFKLPDCTTSNGCLKIVDQNGGSSLPRFNLGWAQEQSLDVDAVSAACPSCNIVVVQAASPSFSNLGTAVQTAARMPGVVAISNSYGGSDAPDNTYGAYYNHPGIAVTASTGDNGYQGASYPASSHYVTAVGGTSLFAASNARGWTESAWSGAGSGCSSYNAAVAPSSFTTDCAGRAMADVAAAADPHNGGLAVYYPTSSKSSTWGQFGGTSEASPIIASVYALSGNTGTKPTATSAGTYANAIPYAHASSLFDVAAGSNGACSPSLWCTAGASWDGPTGLGTPNGVSGF